MKTLLTITAIAEMAAGVALLATPALLVSILLGSALESSAGLVVARVAGAALISLGAVCWFGARDTGSRAATGIVGHTVLQYRRRLTFDRMSISRGYERQWFIACVGVACGGGRLVRGLFKKSKEKT